MKIETSGRERAGEERGERFTAQARKRGNTELVEKTLFRADEKTACG